MQLITIKLLQAGGSHVVLVVHVVFKTKKLSSKQKNIVVFSIMEKTNNTPRGIRNGNPLNIRRTLTKWKGMRETQTDKSFAQFDSLAYGYRAAFILLKQYYRKYRLKTISGIISRWAPPSDGNATSKYISFVCHKAGVEPAEQLPFITEDPMLWFCIVSAMAHQENGQTAGTMNDVILGYVMAFENEMN